VHFVDEHWMKFNIIDDQRYKALSPLTHIHLFRNVTSSERDRHHLEMMYSEYDDVYEIKSHFPRKWNFFNILNNNYITDLQFHAEMWCDWLWTKEVSERNVIKLLLNEMKRKEWEREMWIINIIDFHLGSTF
jgi:hypothetical protein